MNVFTRHRITGQTSYVPEHFLSDELFGDVLEVVPEGTKPLAYTPLEVDEPQTDETQKDDKIATLEKIAEQKKDVK